MILELSAALALARQCAPTTPPATLLPILQVESGFNSLAIGVNRGAAPSAPPRSPGEAAAAARRLLAAGGNLDLGLAQINGGNLDWLGLSVEDAFEPCHNLGAAARVLQAGYRPGVGANPQTALREALSRYNTGDRRRGFTNGYVAKVEAAARQLAPALAAEMGATPSISAAPIGASSGPPPADIFARPSHARRLVFALPIGAGS